MSRPPIWVKAHPRRRPEIIVTPPHAELLEAFQRDQYMAWVAEQIAAEFERDFLQEGAR